jgi:uncharacterized protein (DUF4415 family)
MIKFEWDDAKNRINIGKHGFDFAEASARKIRSALFLSGRQIVKSGNSTKRRSRTDWKRVDALRDEDIDFSDIPEQGPDFFSNAILWPGPKKQITLRLDPDVLAFFRKTGRGYQTTINAVLRKYVESRKGTADR